MSTGAADLARRIEELESQVAFFEAAQHELNEVVTRQDREILQLRQALRELGERMEAMREGVVGDLGTDEAPPHY